MVTLYGVLSSANTSLFYLLYIFVTSGKCMLSTSMLLSVLSVDTVIIIYYHVDFLPFHNL